MALVFDGENGHHAYYLDGVRVPSVTGINQAAGLIQLDHIPAFILDAAKARGTAVHQLVHYYNERDLDWHSVADAYRPYLDAWIAYCADRQPLPYLCEYRVASRRHRVAGTLDLLCAIEHEGWLLDFATGDPADVAKDLQTAAYLGLAYEWAERDDPRLAEVLARHTRWRRGAVRLMRTGTFRFHEYVDPRDYSRFQTLAAAYHIRLERGVKVTLDDLAA